MFKLFKSKWGKYIDLAVGQYNENCYLLQYRRHKNGKIKFRVVTNNKSLWINAGLTLEKFKS